MIDRIAEAAERDVSRETYDSLQHYADLLKIGAEQQNLIAASTIASLWERHILDSAQLVRFEPKSGSHWVDIGSGAGLPGLVIAMLTQGPVQLVEPRRLRAEFLEHCVERLGLGQRVTVVAANAQKVVGAFDVITGRAVSALTNFLGLAHHLSHPGTIWVLPKGRSAERELAEARGSWHYRVRSEASCTNPEARILVLSEVGAKRRR